MIRIRRITAVALALLFVVFTSAGLAQAAAKPAPTGKVNLNTATAEQLTVLPGVGQKLAERIVAYRQKSGGFKSSQELMNVSGIGEKSFQKMQPYLVASDASHPTASK